MTDAIDKHIGDYVRYRRLEMGLSQSDVAARMGLPYQTIQRIEEGRINVSVARLMSAAAALQVPLGYFLQADAAPLPAERCLQSLIAACAGLSRQQIDALAMKARNLPREEREEIEYGQAS
jgi:transcriptional regulator with XRE-family HTH domain